MLRLMIVDDEPLARQGLRELLAAQPDVAVIAEADGIQQAVALVEESRPDAVFLDIRMPEADGFQLFSRLNNAPPVVFVTAHAKYAVRAFDVQAVDYLLKPVEPRRLAQALARVRSAIGQESADPNAYESGDRLCLRTPERTVVAPLADVVALRAEKDFTRVFVAGERPILICQSLGTYERALPSPPFLRLDRSTMLNIARLHSLEISPSRGACAILNGADEPVALGTSALRRLRKALPQHLGNIPGLG